MRIAFVTSECVPYAKTGGLADVSGALPKALEALGCEVKVFVPLYNTIHTLKYDLSFASELQQIEVEIGGQRVVFNTWHGHLPDSTVDVYFIDCPQYYHRGKIYTNDRDEDERFILLQHAAFKVMQHFHWSPDVLHGHDWQAGLTPVYLRRTYGWDQLFQPTASLMTIHNIGYQGRFHHSSLDAAGLGRDLFYLGGPLELHGSFSFLKAGLAFADGISTVSPTYAEEIQTAAFGADLEGLLQARHHDLFGILNGIDTDEWNPATDPHLAQTYTADTLADKQANKRALLEELHLPYDPHVPVLGIVSRLTAQKGFELLQPILSELLHHRPMQLVVLGSGEDKYEDFFRWAASTYPDRVSAYLGYNNALAHRVEAGADIFLMPSRYEPCGLNQMYSLRYGTVPVVRKTGGLADTVQDYHEHNQQGNGFSFYDFTPYALYTSILRAVNLFHDADAWQRVQRRGMEGDFSWQASAEQYLQVYEHLVRKHRG